MMNIRLVHNYFVLVHVLDTERASTFKRRMSLMYVTFACSDDTLIETCACELDHSLHELHLFFEINVVSKYSHKSRKSYFFNASFILVK